MGAGNLRFRVYVGLVACVAAAGFAASWLRGPRVLLDGTMLTLVIAVVVSEIMEVDLPDGGTLSLTYPLSVCAIVLLGPTAAALLAAVSMVPALFSTPRMSPSRLLGNLGQVVLAVLVPGWLYMGLLHGPLLSRGALAAGDLPGVLPALLAAGTVGVFVNAALFVTGYGIMHEVSARRVWRLAISWALAPQLALGLLGLAIAQVMAGEGALGFALFVVPLVVARQTHSRYLSLREAYADTVRSLVAAIEAKDPYTKGHSVRVAGFAVAVAKALGLDDRRVQNIEYASLLHDLGKIGISRAVLSKSGALTEAEYAGVKEHPAIAARILESVPFLDPVLPAVRDHHERMDGHGYGRGLMGSAICVEAKILAVADSYDAMTANRPYRAAMRPDEAVSELRANLGTQFDPEIVEVFLTILPGFDSHDILSQPEGRTQGGAAVVEA